jgi:hypothetical protein
MDLRHRPSNVHLATLLEANPLAQGVVGAAAVTVIADTVTTEMQAPTRDPQEKDQVNFASLRLENSICLNLSFMIVPRCSKAHSFSPYRQQLRAE